jgi:hypothetical protein
MPNPSTPLNRRDFEARIIAKAWKDPNYRQVLLANPKAVLQQEIAALDPSVALPAGLQVQVHEEAPNVYHLVLPRNPKDISLGELLGDNLEVVAPQTAALAVVTVGNVIATPAQNVVVCNVVATIQNVNIVALQVASINANAVSNVLV